MNELYIGKDLISDHELNNNWNYRTDAEDCSVATMTIFGSLSKGSNRKLFKMAYFLVNLKCQVHIGNTSQSPKSLQLNRCGPKHSFIAIVSREIVEFHGNLL